MLESAQVQEASTAVRELRIALSNFFLYASGNNMTLLSIQRFLGALDGLFQQLPSVTLGESEGRLVVEGTPLDERTTGSTNMIRDLFLSHKLQSLTFEKGVDTEELKVLFALLRPKGLPPGLSLSQALVQKSLQYVRANEKVFVALSEGETVVQTDAVPKGPQGEQNLQEALEALQYFLQIFARVKPDSNKKEVARRLMDNMGAWLGSGDAGPVGKMPAGPGTSQAGSTSSPQAWMEVLGAVMALKNGLASAKTPGDVQSSRTGMEDLLQKLVLLGQQQGIDIKEEDITPAAAVPSPLTPRPAPVRDAEKEKLFETLERGDLEIFWDPAMEEKLDAEDILRFQEPERADIFGKLWDGLWKKIAAGDEKTQALCLRHLNRLNWDRLSRVHQVEGLRNLGLILSTTRRAAIYPIGLTLAQDWIPLEMGEKDWTELLKLVKVLKQLMDKRPPDFDKQNLAAKVALETIFCEPILKACLENYRPGTPEGAFRLQIFATLNHLVTPFLFWRMEEEVSESQAWTKIVEFLNAIQGTGAHIYETWLERPEKKGQVEKFLDIFKVTPLSGELEDYFERHWTSFGPQAQEKILESIEIWDRKGARPFLLRLLEKPETHAAFHALRVLAKVGMEGDALAIAAAVQKYPAPNKGRERFWVEACRAMGDMEGPAGSETLMEWAAKYKFMESKKERSLEVRRAAVESLGRFRSRTVKIFLESLRKDGDKEMAPSVDAALTCVEGLLNKAAEPKYEN